MFLRIFRGTHWENLPLPSLVRHSYIILNYVIFVGGGEKKKTGRGKNGGKTVGAANRRYRRMSDLVGKGEKKEKGNKTESTWRRRTRLQLAFV